MANSVGIPALSVEGGKIFSQTNGHILFSRAECSSRPDRRYPASGRTDSDVRNVTAEIGPMLYVGWHSKPLREPEKTIVAETMQVRVQPSQVELGLPFAHRSTVSCQIYPALHRQGRQNGTRA